MATLLPTKEIVVSIGTNPTFKEEKVPMEYVPTILVPHFVFLTMRHQYFSCTFCVKRASAVAFVIKLQIESMLRAVP